MRNWRVLVAIAAVVLAGAAAYLSYEYAHKADTRAQKNVERVSVLVAKNDISKGTTAAQALNSGLIGSKSVPRGVLPPAAVANAADLTDKIAVGSIAKGQFIVTESFVKAAEVGGFSSTIPKGKEAITITVDSSHGVAGFVQPGDRINVLWTGPQGDQKGGVPGAPARMTAFLLPGVKVLAVGETTANSAPAEGASTSGEAAGANPSSSGSQSKGLLTLEVTPRQAEQVAHGVSTGTFYVSLNTPGFDPTGFTPPDEIVETWNLFDQHLAELDKYRTR